jgi:hypothetical protein
MVYNKDFSVEDSFEMTSNRVAAYQKIRSNRKTILLFISFLFHQ